eukprot:NODE_2467_length_564_cov_114.613272_g2417_i0.p2 GENE.NODE_2467_length_564_cov_114.613272_g2417_i0~~NODE_2467_length_564_cov_114.613272_g2417_i0.p2  ORF type:complete len:112 (+),score=5.13 NODE_2467_length_564_cov_114.613272_g2417_i0:91-426(+)
MGDAPWDAQLFDCCSEAKICVVTYFCAPCQLAHQRAVVQEHECGVVDCLLMYFFGICCAVMVRGEIRNKYAIKGSCIGDCLTLWCCGWCAITQQHRQLKVKGNKPAGCCMD